MLRKLQYLCLAGSIGLVGADRIDLFGGHGPFILTPFLVLATLVILLHFLRLGLNQGLHFAITPPIRRQIPYIAAGSLFLIFSFASIPLSLDVDRSIVAFGDLLVVAVLGYFLSLEILAEPEKDKLIARSVTFGLVIYVIFCVGECIAWTHGILIDSNRSGPWLESMFAPSTLGPWVPTLAGTTFDANRSGFILIMYLVLLDRFAAKSRCTPVLRFTIGVLVLGTLSRSAALCWLAYYVSSKKFWTRLATRRVAIRVAAVVVTLSILCVIYQKEILGLAEAWEISDAISAKMSMDQGSSGESHVLLIERGFKTWLTSTKTIIAGIGYAAAPKVLEDFFGYDKRSNFHCIYVTALAEMGLPAFLTLMFIFIYPIIGRRGAVPGMVAIMAFNISYQSHTEPVFWLILALLWSYERKGSPAFRWLALLQPLGDRRFVNASS